MNGDESAEEVVARSVILGALAKVMGEVEFLAKDDTNPHFKYAYVSEAHALATLRPAMLRAGLFLIPSVDELRTPRTPDDSNRTHVLVNYTLAHSTGVVWPEVLTFAGCGQDTQDKGVAKGMTMANKYMLFKLFQIPTVDDEPDAATPERKFDEWVPPASPARTQNAPAAPAFPPPGAPAPAPALGSLTAGHLKTNGVWKRAFAAAETVGAAKFAALDWAVNELGANRWEDLTTDHIPELLRAIDRFPDFYVSQAPPDDGIPF